MDAGIASAENIAWLIARGYLYLVVSRERHVKDPGGQQRAVQVRETEQSNVTVYRKIDAKTGETRLYCHSEQKAKKEQAIRNRFHACPELVEGFVWKRRSTSSMPAWTKKVPPKTTRKYLDDSVGCAKKTAVSRATTALKSLPMTKKTMPPVLNGVVNRKVNKKTPTAVFTA
jgi:hypothetical protein